MNLFADAGCPTDEQSTGANAALHWMTPAREGESAAANEFVEATSVQSTLKLAGYWPGPADGQVDARTRGGLKEVPANLALLPVDG